MAWTQDGTELLCQDQHRINIVSVEGNAEQRSIADVTDAAAAESTDAGLEVEAMYTFALSADDAQIVSSHKSGLLKLWQSTDGALLKQWKAIHQGPVPRLTFNPAGTLIASGGTDASVRLWNAEQRVCLGALRGCSGVISVLAFQTNGGGLVVAAGDDHRIHVWSVETRELKHVLSGHFSRITAVSFGHGDGAGAGEWLVSSGRDKVLMLWDLAAGKMVRTVPTYESLEGVVVLGDDAVVPEGEYRSDVKVQFEQPHFIVHTLSSTGIAREPGHVYAAVAGSNGAVKIWNLTVGRAVYEQADSLIARAAEDEGVAVAALLYNAQRSQLALVSADHNIMVYNTGTFHCAKQLIGFSDEILDTVFVGKKGRYLAVATNSAAIKLYDTASAMNCRILLGHTDIVLALASHRNYLLSSAKDCTVRLWLLDPGTFTVRHVATATKHTAAVGSVAFGRLSHTICASVSQDTCLKVWTLPETFAADAAALSMQCTATQIAHEKDVNSVTISPNDLMIATGSQDKTAKLWSAANLALVGVFRGHKRGIWCVRFSPVDQVLLTSSADCTLRLWSLTDRSCLKSFEGHESSILRVEFLSGGMQLLSAGADGLLKVWSVKTAECAVTLDGHEGRVWALAVGHDERHFYSGGSDSLLMRWRDVTVERREAAQRAEQELAEQEQELSNLLAGKKLLGALRLALRLDKPLLSLRIITGLIRTDEGVEELEPTIAKLADAQKDALMRHAVAWNTNSRNCRAAQLVIRLIVRDILNGSFRPSTGLERLIEETLPYTERHFKRMTEYMKDLKFLEYTMRCMQPHGGAVDAVASKAMDEDSSDDE